MTFIFSPRAFCNGTLTIMENSPVTDDVPPDGFVRFFAQINAVANGQVVGQMNVEIVADDIEQAFEMAPKLIEDAKTRLPAEMKKAALRQSIVNPHAPVLNGGRMRLTE